MNPPAANPCIESAANWKAARKLVTFEPAVPARTAGFTLQGLRVFVRDHKLRELAACDRTLEAHYGAFVFTQQRRGSASEARRQALDVPYGRAGRPIEIAGRAARVYELGPEVPPDDIDGRSPAVVVWHDGDIVYFLASDTLEAAELVGIAVSVHGRPKRVSRRIYKH